MPTFEDKPTYKPPDVVKPQPKEPVVTADNYSGQPATAAGGKYPQKIIQILTPSGKTISVDPYKTPERMLAIEKAGFVLPTLIPNLYELTHKEGITEGTGRTYWENPYKIGRYHEFIQNAPPDWQPPEWLDVKAIQSAYKYLNYRNENRPVSEWKYLPDDDPGTSFLKGMPLPPAETLFDYELKQQEEYERQLKIAQAQIGSWEKLGWAQKALMYSPMSPQPVIGEAADQEVDIGRPTVSKIVSNLLRSGMSAMAGYGLGATLAKLGIVALGGASLPAVGTIALVGGVTLGIATLIQTMTGKKVPVIGDAAEMLQPLSWASAAFEIGAGVVDQLLQEGDFKEVWENLPEAVQAASANYETNAKSYMLDIAAGLSGIRSAEKGEVWRIDLGQSEPVKLPEGILTGSDALTDLRHRLMAAGDDKQVKDQIVANYISNFGFQGTLNDFVLQNILDPLNVEPTIGQAVAAKYADILSGKLPDVPEVAAMKAAFEYPTTRNLAVDAMPFPVNFIFSHTTKWQGSAGWIDGLARYKTFINTGFYPGWKVPADYTAKPDSTNLDNVVKITDTNIDGTPKFDSEGVDVTYRKWVEDRWVNPKDLSNAQKQLGNLDPETGLPKDFTPTVKKVAGDSLIQKGLVGIGNLFNYVFNLTPASKARLSLANLSSHMDRIYFDLADGNIETFGRMINALAQVDPEMTGTRLAELMQPPGKAGMPVDPRFFVSPIGMSLALSIRKMAEGGTIDEWIATNWVAPSLNRSLLNKAARLLEVKPGDVIERMTKGEDIASLLRTKATAAGIKGFEGLTNEAFTEQMKIFTGAKAVPFDERAAYAELSNTIKDNMGQFMVDRFGIAPDPKWQRFSHVLKSMQSLLVLGLNPTFLVNNLINDVITRSYAGVAGFMTNKQIVGLMDRLGIDPQRADLGLWDMDTKRAGEDIINKAKDIESPDRVDKMLQGASRVIKDIDKTIGVFGKLAHLVERSESRQAYTIGLMQIQNQLWRPGVGISRLPDSVAKQLTQEQQDQLYRQAMNSWNSAEVEANFFDPNAKLSVSQILDSVAEQYASQHTTMIKDPEMVKDLLVRTGILAELENGVKNASRNNYGQVFDDAVDTVDLAVKKLVANDIQARAEAMESIVKQEGITAAISELSDVELDFAKEWILHFVEWGVLMSRKSTMDSASFARLVDQQKVKDNIRFERLFEWEAETLKGVLKALGFDENIPQVKNILQAHVSIRDSWRDFYKTREKLYSDFISKRYDTDGDYQKALDQVREEVDALSEAAWNRELDMIKVQNENYIALAKDKAVAKAWRDEYLSIRTNMIEDMRGFRKWLIDNPPPDLVTINAMWNSFINERYVGRIAALKSTESRMAGITAASDYKSIPDTISDNFYNNRYDDISPFLKDKFAKEADKMLGEFGEPGFRTPVPGTSGKEWTGYGSTHPQWYKDLNAQDNGVDKQAVKNALQYIVDGVDKSNRYSVRMKDEIMGRLGGFTASLDGYVPDLGVLWHMGYKENAAADYMQHYTTMENYTDDVLVRALGGKQYASEMIDYVYDEYLPREWVREKFSEEYESKRWTKNRNSGEVFESDEPGTTLRRSLGQYTLEQVDATIAMMDLHAQHWAQKNGKTVGEWWSSKVKDVLVGEVIKSDEGNIKPYTPQEIEAFRSVNPVLLKEAMEATDVDSFIKNIESKPNRKSTANISTDDLTEFYNRVKAPLSQEQIAVINNNLLLKEGSLSFLDDGAAILRFSNKADITTLVHEPMHIFIRDVGGDDLEAFSRWGGLDSADEYLTLREQFDNGKLKGTKLDRYRAMEEKVADGFTEYLTKDHTNLPDNIQSVFKQFISWIVEIWHKLTDSNKPTIKLNADIDIGNGKKVNILQAYDRLFTDTLGRNPLGTTPEPAWNGKALSEVADDNLKPLLMSMREEYIHAEKTYKPLVVKDLPASVKGDVMNWVNSLKGQQASVKMAADQYAQHLRDEALLNYQKQTEFDTLANVVFPYQFWYTRTMMNYARRAFEKPAMFGWYYRYRKAQEKMQADGMPARFYGKMRINAPYLPDWMGGGLFIDPMKQLFPFSQMLDPINQAASRENSAKYAAYRALNDMVANGQISEMEADNARESMSGPVWDQAYAIGIKESDINSPMTLASMMMTPGMYLTIPILSIQGQPEKISPTPMLRTSQAARTALKGTLLEPLGNIVGLIGEPERMLRQTVMTPAKAMFGEFGDYYVERNIANMVANGEISLDEALQGISLHEGNAYQTGLERTHEEVALRVPGVLPFIAVKNGATIPDVAWSILVGLYPSGLLPEGELEYIKNKREYSKAWDQYKLGYKDKLNDFFNKHPEYEARIALKAEPEEKLQQYLISEIWDRYYQLDSVNKNAVTKQFGSLFQERFMNSDTRNYEGIGLETLARWAFQLGAYLPQQSIELQGLNQQVQAGQVEGLDLWNPDIAAAYTEYQDQRKALFPNYYAVQSQYYALPKNQRNAFKREFPELEQYWTWKRQYAQDHPEIQGVLESVAAEQAEQQTIQQETVDNLQPELVEQLMAYFMVGQNPTPGAWMALQYAWEKAGRPYGDLGEWIENIVKPSFT